jgi:two-component system, chemotaxis family, sensor kinase CheA
VSAPADYLPIFLAEAREHLQELGLAVVRIEAVPEDRKTAERVFRVAHSLKGMSATMGFERIAALTHAMEDVFELLRQRTAGLSRESVDVLSACLDALEAAVESIAEHGEERLDPAPLVARLEALARGRTPEQELDRAGGAALPDLSRPVADGRRVVHVAAELDPQAPMPGARAFLLFQALAVHGELVGSVPAPDGVERFGGRRVEVWVESDVDATALEATAATVGDVVRVAVRDARPGPAPSVGLAGEAPAARTGASVRVDAQRLDELLHLMGELVVHRTAVEALAADAGVPGLGAALQRLARSSQALQEVVTHVRMVPVETVFARFPRLVRDLAGRLGKEVELRLGGGDTELDRTVVDALGDPLVHLVRNALDHGLETARERLAAGKPPAGVLEISARHAGGHVIVGVRDDGRGIDPARVGRAALQSGLIDAEAAASLDAARAVELLFAPGFSTAAATTDVSGRGVGMDAVRADVRALGGEVTLMSEPGAGTLAEVRLPLTLASISALLVAAHGQSFAIPLDRVERTLRLADHALRSAGGAPLLVLGDEVLPLLDAGAALAGGTGVSGAPDGYAVVLRGAERRLALVVAALAGQRELVTRPLPHALRGRAPVASGAVLPDGTVALVVDCDALAAPVAPCPTAPADPALAAAA